MRNDFYSYKIIDSKKASAFSDFYNVMENKNLDANWDFINDRYIQIQSRVKDDEQRPLSKDTNLSVGVFCTAYARAYLWKAMNSSICKPESVCYHDTDSIVFKAPMVAFPSQDPRFPIGGFLGQFTSELGEGDFMLKWASAGPKNYSFETKDKISVMKSKGFNLSKHHVKELFSWEKFSEAIEAMVKGKEKVKIMVDFPMEKGGLIKRFKNGVIESQKGFKTWQCVYTKRIPFIEGESPCGKLIIGSVPFSPPPASSS